MNGVLADDAPWDLPGADDHVFTDAAVRRASEIVDRLEVVATVAGWREDDRERAGRHAGGAPVRFPERAVWVAMVLHAYHGLPMLASDWLTTLLDRISPDMRGELGIPDPPPATDVKAREALYRCVRTRFHTILATVDPSPRPKNRRRDGATYEALASRLADDFDPADQVLRFDRLHWLANTILEATFLYLPRDVRRAWKGSVALDATPVPAFARPDHRKKGKKPRAERELIRSSADPDAGLYVRTDDDRLQVDSGKTLRKMFWAYEATLVVAGNDDPTFDHAFPTITVGMAPLHRPATAVAQNAMRALSSVASRGHPAGWLAADRAYTHALPDAYQLPAQALGYRPVHDYRKDQLGVQASHAGALQIEGNWYCPAIPQALIDATSDYRDGAITEETRQQRVAARGNYLLRPKERPDPEGHARLTCAAAGHAPTVRCENKPASIGRTTSASHRVHPELTIVNTPPQICAQQTATFPPEAGAKLAQTLRYGTPEWAAVYHTLRNSIEGINGIAKDGAHSALGDASRRRIRGVAAQTLFTALLLLADNLRMIRSFLTHAVPDATGTKRRPRRRRTRSLQKHRPTLASSGVPPP